MPTAHAGLDALTLKAAISDTQQRRPQAATWRWHARPRPPNAAANAR